MAGQLLMINPAKRNKKGQFIKKVVKRKKAASPRKTVVSVSANPVKRRKRRAVSALAKRRVTRRYKRNPSSLKLDMKQLMKSAVMPSVVSSVGALGLDILVGYVNQSLLKDKPELQSGIGAGAVKFAGAVALGFLASKIKGREFGIQVMTGGMTVTLHQLLRQSVQGMTGADGMPMIPLDGMGVYDDTLGRYDNTLGYYTNGYNGIPTSDLGGYTPAMVAGLGDGRAYAGWENLPTVDVFN